MIKHTFPYANIEIRQDGAIVLRPMPKEEMDINDLHRAVGGFIEIVRPNPVTLLDKLGYRMIVNDEGAIRPEFKRNALASMIYGGDIYGDVVVGVFLDTREPDVYNMPYTEAHKLVEYLQDMKGAIAAYD